MAKPKLRSGIGTAVQGRPSPKGARLNRTPGPGMPRPDRAGTLPRSKTPKSGGPRRSAAGGLAKSDSGRLNQPSAAYKTTQIRRSRDVFKTDRATGTRERLSPPPPNKYPVAPNLKLPAGPAFVKTAKLDPSQVLVRPDSRTPAQRMGRTPAQANDLRKAPASSAPRSRRLAALDSNSRYSGGV